MSRNHTFIEIQPFLKKRGVSFTSILEEDTFKAFLKIIEGKQKAPADSFYEIDAVKGTVAVYPLIFVYLLLFLEPLFCYDASIVLLDCVSGKYSNLALFCTENDFFTDSESEEPQIQPEEENE